MNPAKLRWVALALALFVVLVGYLALTKSVTIEVDGRTLQLETRSLTVGGALRAAGVQWSAQDVVSPSTWQPLWLDTQVTLHRAARIQLSVDGATYQTTSGERRLPELLAQWRLALGPEDRILLAGQTIGLEDQLPDLPFLSLVIRRAVPVTVHNGEDTLSFQSSALTLGQALVEQGVALQAAEQIEPPLETPLDAAVTVTLSRGRPLTVDLDGAQLQLTSSAATVGEALAQAGIALQGQDYSRPAAGQPLPADGAVEVVRVRELVELSQNIVPHETQWQEDPEAELDTISIVQLGQDGVSASRTHVRYENGEEVSRREEDARVIVEPQTQINGYGSKLVIRTEVVDGVTIEYYRKATFRTTWYSPCNSGTSSCLNGTSSGMPVQRGTVATYLDIYRELVGATLYIPGYGPAAVGDNNGAYSNGNTPWLDLAFSEAEVAAANGAPWANATVTVYFTTPVPSYVPPVWPP